jgi:hypothetical protein
MYYILWLREMELKRANLEKKYREPNIGLMRNAWKVKKWREALKYFKEKR